MRTKASPSAQRAIHEDRANALSMLDECQVRPTHGRVSVLQLFMTGKSYTPQDLHIELLNNRAGVSLATTYRALSELVDYGVLSRQRPEDGPCNYFLHGKEEEKQLICTTCGTVIYIPTKKLANALRTIAKASGVVLEGYKLQLQGRCSTCPP